MRQLKSKFKINKKVTSKSKKRRIKNRMFPILLSLLIISLTFATTEAYFNSKFSFASLMGKDKEGILNIVNGNVKWTFGNKPTSWFMEGEELPSSGSETYISNPENGQIITYGPVVMTSNSNITTNVDLAVDFTLEKIGGVEESGEGGSGSTEVTDASKKVEPFEVIVGDIDNFGYTFYKNRNIGWDAYSNFNGATELSSNMYDIYNDYNIPFNRAFGMVQVGEEAHPASTQYSRRNNGMSVFPSNNYDATGTDRRMVNSGFYDWLYNNGFSNVLGKGDAYSTLGNRTGWNFGYNKGEAESIAAKDYYNNNACYYWAWFGSSATKAWYDGYTDRALKGIYGVWSGIFPSEEHFNTYANDVWVGRENDKYANSIINGTTINKNWKYLNKVEPLTFRYGKIPEDGELHSICIQIYVDDLQPQHYSYSDKSSFSYVSQNKYKVSISSDGTNWIEIPEWSSVINNLSQSGPSGYMATLNVDTKNESITNIFKEASGLNGSGLKVKIDDEIQVRTVNGEKTISGDSYAIDFAKMTVNGNIDATTDNKINISGKVIDNKTLNPIDGVTVITSNAASTETSSDGMYSLKPVKERMTIKFIKEGYKTVTKEIDGTGDITLNVQMEPKTTTSAKNKIDIEVIIDELVQGEVISTDASKVTRAKLKRMDSEGKNLINFAEIEEGEPELTVDEDGHSVIRTVTKYNNISSISTAIQQAQCSIGLSPGSIYKVYYKLVLKDKASIDEISDEFSLEFTSSLTAKATQENNPGWGVNGDGELYGASYLATGTAVAETDTPLVTTNESENIHEESTSEIDNILKNNIPEIYFQNARGWNSPVIELNGAMISSTSKLNETYNWYRGSLDSGNTLRKSSTIYVRDSSNNNNNSGKLYYFNTKKVFICTE